jgi:hypothetical protein
MLQKKWAKWLIFLCFFKKYSFFVYICAMISSLARKTGVIPNAFG